MFVCGNVYYYRARIPHDLLEIYHPAKGIKISLKTSDKDVAIKAVRLKSVSVLDEFERRRADLPKTITIGVDSNAIRYLSDDDITCFCDRWLFEVLDGDEHKRRNGIDADTFGKMSEEYVAIDQEIKNALAYGDTSIIQNDLNFALFLMKVDRKLLIYLNMFRIPLLRLDRQ